METKRQRRRQKLRVSTEMATSMTETGMATAFRKHRANTERRIFPPVAAVALQHHQRRTQCLYLPFQACNHDPIHNHDQ
eukprot:3829452-Ditylum_brightwellii.AAC.1